MEATKDKQGIMATGRRKEAIARVRLLTSGQGKYFINGKPIENYFPNINHQAQIKKPLMVVDYENKVDVKAKVHGGGISGQAGAVSLGISRALVSLEPELRSILRKAQLLTRDPRAKERKKYGKRGARRSVQWTKR